jgi:hypothetical protein
VYRPCGSLKVAASANQAIRKRAASAYASSRSYRQPTV